MQLKKNAKSQGYSDNYLYNIRYGNIKPEQVLENKEDIDKVNDAINKHNDAMDTLDVFFDELEGAGLLERF